MTRGFQRICFAPAGHMNWFSTSSRKSSSRRTRMDGIGRVVCTTCGKWKESQASLERHIKKEHEVEVRISYTWPARNLTLMYNDDTAEMERMSGDQFEAQISVAEGELHFCFIVDGEQFRVASNHPQLPGGNQNVVEIKKKGSGRVQEIRCTGYSFDQRISSESSQYTSGGSSACTPIAMEAISRMLAGKMQKLKSPTIDAVLRNGSKWYDQLKPICQSAGVDHLMPSEVYHSCEALSNEMDYIGWCSGDGGFDQFEKIHKLAKFSERTGAAVGATLTTMNMTLGICLSGPGDAPVLFDSHSTDYGDGQPSGASLFYFKDMQQLQVFLTEKFPQIDGLALTAFSQYELNVFAKKGMQLESQKESEDLFEKPTSPAGIGSDPTPDSPNPIMKIEEEDRIAAVEPSHHSNFSQDPVCSPSLDALIRNANMASTDSPKSGLDRPTPSLTGGILPTPSDHPSNGQRDGRTAGTREGGVMSLQLRSPGSNSEHPKGLEVEAASSHTQTSNAIMVGLNDIIKSSFSVCDEIRADVDRAGGELKWVARSRILTASVRKLQDRLKILHGSLDGDAREYATQVFEFNEFLEMVNSHVHKFNEAGGVESVKKMMAIWRNLNQLWHNCMPVLLGPTRKACEENREMAPCQSEPTATAEPVRIPHTSRPPPQKCSMIDTADPGPSLDQATGLGGGSASGNQQFPLEDNAIPSNQDADRSSVSLLYSNREVGSSGRVRGEARMTPAPARRVDDRRTGSDQEMQTHNRATGGEDDGGWTQVNGRSTKRHDGAASTYPTDAVSTRNPTRYKFSQDSSTHESVMEACQSGVASRQSHQDAHDVSTRAQTQHSGPEFTGGRFHLKGQGEGRWDGTRPEGRVQPSSEYSECGLTVWEMLRSQGLIDKGIDTDMSLWSLRCHSCTRDLVLSVLLIIMEASIHSPGCRTPLPAFGFSDLPSLARTEGNRIVCRCERVIGILATKDAEGKTTCGGCGERSMERVRCVNARDAETVGETYYFLYINCLKVHHPT